MPLSDRLEAQRRIEAGEDAATEADSDNGYEQLTADLVARVNRLSQYRGRSDRARIVHQLTEIDRRVHALLDEVGGG